MRRLVAALAMMGALAACSTHEPIEPPRGTALEAQAMVARAIAAYEMDGDAAFVAMTPPRQDFVDRDLYMFVVGPDNIVVAQGADASRVGTDVTTLVDADGFAGTVQHGVVERERPAEQRVGRAGEPEHDELPRPDRGGDLGAFEADPVGALGEPDVFDDSGGAVVHRSGEEGGAARFRR